MKRSSIGGIALAAAVGCALLAMAWKASAGNTGAGILSTVVNTARFMLFGGSFVPSGSQQAEPGVFKIDSYTGDVWMLKIETANGQRVERWAPVLNAPPPPQSAPGRLPGAEQ